MGKTAVELTLLHDESCANGEFHFRSSRRQFVVSVRDGDTFGRFTPNGFSFLSRGKWGKVYFVVPRVMRPPRGVKSKEGDPKEWVLVCRECEKPAVIPWVYLAYVGSEESSDWLYSCQYCRGDMVLPQDASQISTPICREIATSNGQLLPDGVVSHFCRPFGVKDGAPTLRALRRARSSG